MSFWRGGFARRALVGAAIIALFAQVTLVGAGPALAQSGSDTPFPGAIVVRSFTNSAGFKVEFRAWIDRFDVPEEAPLQLCLFASRSTRVGPHTREVAVEAGCSFDFRGFSWDQMSWTGWISGSLRTFKTVETITHKRDEWKVESRVSRESRTRIALEWTPVSGIRPEVYAMPFLCYAGPPFGPVCVAWYMRWARSVEFVGGFKFEGFSMGTKLAPGGHPGREWLGSP